MSKCRSCDAEIQWARTFDARKPIPLDEKPSPQGNLVVIDGHRCQDGTPIVRKVEINDAPAARRTSHFATCPDAKGWRR